MLIKKKYGKFVHSIRPFRAIFVCMNVLEKNINAAVQSIISEFDVMLIDCIINGKQKLVIQIYIDGYESVSAALCAEISRAINKKIENEIVPDIPYRLEVSSPGVDRSLLFLKQYHKHLNRNFSLQVSGSDGIIKYEGKLVKIEEENLTFSSPKGEEIIFNFKNIKKAFVKISFS